MTQNEFRTKSEEIAQHLGFQIVIEENVVFLESEDIRSEFLRVKNPHQRWRLIYSELSKWNEGCDLISPIK